MRTESRALLLCALHVLGDFAYPCLRLQTHRRMSVSGKKEFDVKQILRLRWRWFSHSSQGSAGSGGGGIGGVGSYIQQDGIDHRGTPVQGRLKSHSRERGVGGLRKTNSPARSILAPTPGPTPVYVREGHQSWHHQQNTIQGLQVSEESSKCSSSPSNTRKEDTNIGKENVKSNTEEPAEVEARDRYDWYEVLRTVADCLLLEKIHALTCVS